MKYLLLLVAVVSIGIPTLAGEGAKGGGDPDAVDFLDRAKLIQHWIAENRSFMPDVDVQDMLKKIQDVEASLDGKTEPLLVFTSEKVTDSFGNSKGGNFGIKGPGVITINRPMWYGESEHKGNSKKTPAEIEQWRYETAGLEVFGLMNLNDRYGKAAVIGNHITQILYYKNWDKPFELKPRLVLSDIYEFDGVAKVNLVKMVVNFNPHVEVNGEYSMVFFHPGYKTELLNKLCKDLGYGKSIDLTYVNVTSEVRDGDLILNRDGKFRMGINLKDPLQKEYGNLKTSILNGFICTVKQ